MTLKISKPSLSASKINKITFLYIKLVKHCLRLPKFDENYLLIKKLVNKLCLISEIVNYCHQFLNLVNLRLQIIKLVKCTQFENNDGFVFKKLKIMEKHHF